MEPLPQFDRYELGGLSSFAAICRGRGPGIYVLEFLDGTQYVGQTRDFGRRLWQHKHGGAHHEPWSDLVAFSLLDAPSESLDELEKLVIASLRAAGTELRNKTYNFGHRMAAPIDVVFPVLDREHWATTREEFDLECFRTGALRTPGPVPKLFKSAEGRRLLTPMSGTGAELTVAEACVMVLGKVLKYIPHAPKLEGEYWTISDYPATVGGRILTLNVGRLELLYVPRRIIQYFDAEQRVVDCFEVCINFPQGTFLSVTPGDEALEVGLPQGVTAYAVRTDYTLTNTDTLCVALDELLTLVDAPDLEDILRRFIVDLMVDGPSGIFKRWHCPELARRGYEAAVKNF